MSPDKPKSAQNGPTRVLGPLPGCSLPPDTALLLALLDLKTERLLAEVEPIIIRNACIEATYAAIEDRDELS